MAIFNTRRAVTESYEDVNIDDILPDVDTSNIPDNIDEAVSGILYSNERNWNMLMQTVGIAELSCMESEGNVIYEAADIKALFKKIGDFFKSVLDKIAGFFRKIVEKVQEWFFSIKKKMNEKKFKDLTQVPANFEYEGYDFIDNLDKFAVKPDADGTDYWAETLEGIDNAIKNNMSPDEAKEKYNKFPKDLTEATMKATILSRILSGADIDTSKPDMAKDIFKYFRSGKDKPEKILAKDIDISIYKNTINTNLATVKKSVATDYKSLQDYVNKKIKDLEDKIKGDKIDGVDEKYISVAVTMVNDATKYLKMELDVSSQVYSGQLKALHDQSKQYYGALVKMLSSKSSSEEKKDDKKEKKAQTESFGFSHSILDNVSFI